MCRINCFRFSIRILLSGVLLYGLKKERKEKSKRKRSVNQKFRLKTLLKEKGKGSYFSSVPVFTKQRSLLPFFTSIRTRPPFPVLESTGSILEACTGASFSTIPPLGFFWLGFVCFLTRLTPSISTLEPMILRILCLAAFFLSGSNLY